MTTKDELYLQLGEPDFASEDGRQLGYAWTKVKAIWAVGGNVGGAAGEFQRRYVLTAFFDQSNRLSQLQFTNRWACQNR